ncbi:hypothetical protein ACQPZJ_01935 [Actinoplanes sp. CA-054009]
MTPARSLAASVVALGFTGALSAPLPAFAAPAPCERAESYAAQSGAELLRIEKLAVQVPDVRYKKSKPKTESGQDTGAAARVLGAVDDPIADPEDSDTISEGIGMLGTAVLGSLTPRPKAKMATGGEADVVTPADEVTGRLGEAADRGGSLVNGLTAASGQASAVSGRSGAGGSNSAVSGASGASDVSGGSGASAVSGGGGAGGAMKGAVAESRVNAAGVVAARNPGSATADEDDSGDANGSGAGSGAKSSGGNRSGGNGAGGNGAGGNGAGGNGDGGNGDGGNGDGGADAGDGSDGGADAGGDGVGGAGDEGAAGNDGTARDGSGKSGDGRNKSGDDGDSGVGSTSDDADGGADSAGANGAGEGVAAESGKTATLSDVGVGETRTAMIAEAKVSAAAYGRLLDGQAKGGSELSKPLLQKAPPTNPEAARRATSAGKVGPLKLGSGQMTAHAQWEAGMACGRAVGETTRSAAGIVSLRLLDGLVGVPEKLESESTTALERSGEAARSVASSTVKAGRIELADGRVRVRVLRAPALTTSMSAAEGGKVDYRPALVEVSGDGIATKRLEAAGDHADITLTPQRHATESVPLSRLSGLTSLGQGGRLPVPAVPGLPPVAAAPGLPPVTAAPKTESGTTTGTRLRVSLGDVRHATKGTAIAARATAIKVSLVQTTGTKGRGKSGYGPQGRTTLDMAFGLLESAAVAPPAGPPAGAGAGGAGGGLPVTGPRLDRLALAGGTLLVAGIAAVAVTMRRRRSRS